jgi:S1-C subfamily serine protease
VVVTLGLTPVLRAESMLELVNREVAAIYERSKFAIVKVHASRPYMATGRQTIQWQRVGTGFFIDTNGTILTTSSVAEQGETFWIEWDNQKIPMRLVGSDPHSRLAVMKIDAEKFPTAQIKTPLLPVGNTSDLKVGSLVILIGHPYDLPSAPSVGFVGGFDIQCGGHYFVTNHIRSTSRLSPGQQGGPLLNIRGEVVGVPVAAHLDDQSYAVPIQAAKRIWTELLEKGRVDYGWIGMTVTERAVPSATPTNAPSTGALPMPITEVVVTQVLPDTPAARAGLTNGDVVMQVYTNDVRRIADVLNTMFGFRDGDQLPVKVLRNDAMMQLNMIVAPMPATTARNARSLAPSSTATNATPAIKMPPVVPASAGSDGTK